MASVPIGSTSSLNMGDSLSSLERLSDMEPLRPPEIPSASSPPIGLRSPPSYESPVAPMSAPAGLPAPDYGLEMPQHPASAPVAPAEYASPPPLQEIAPVLEAPLQQAEVLSPPVLEEPAEPGMVSRSMDWMKNKTKNFGITDALNVVLIIVVIVALAFITYALFTLFNVQWKYFDLGLMAVGGVTGDDSYEKFKEEAPHGLNIEEIPEPHDPNPNAHPLI